MFKSGILGPQAQNVELAVALLILRTSIVAIEILPPYLKCVYCLT